MLSVDMNTRIATAALAVAAAVLAACGPSTPAVDKIAIEKSVNAVEKAMMKDANAKDAAAFATHYAANAVFMSPGAPAMRGPDAIVAGLKPLFADANFKIDFAADRTEIADSGDMASTRGSYTMTATDPATGKPVDDKGSYVTVFRKQTDGMWKAVLDINASELPPRQPRLPGRNRK